MSVLAPGRLGCPCGNQLDVEFCESIDATRRTDLRDQILDGTLHKFTCPACGRSVVVEKHFVYMDFGARHWFTVAPESALYAWRDLTERAKASFKSSMEVNAPPLVRSWAPSFLQRAVFGVASLGEKLRLLDAGLDDRRVELFKLQLLRDLGLVLDARTRLRFHRLYGGQLLFHYGEPEAPTLRELFIPLETFEAAPEPGADLSQALPELLHDVVVDFRIAFITPQPYVPSAAEPTPEVDPKVRS